MKQEQFILEKTDGIYDIQPPAVPDLSNIELLLLTLIFLVALGFTVYLAWIFLFSVKGKIKRQIKQLKTLHTNNMITTHNTIYQLCHLLQQGLKINHIGGDILLPEKIEQHKREWLSFTIELSKLRYKKTENDKHDINDIFNMSLYWLKMWP